MPLGQNDQPHTLVFHLFYIPLCHCHIHKGGSGRYVFPHLAQIHNYVLHLSYPNSMIPTYIRYTMFVSIVYTMDNRIFYKMNVVFLTDYYAFYVEGLKELWSCRLQPYTLTSVLPKIQISLNKIIKLKRFLINISIILCK